MKPMPVLYPAGHKHNVKQTKPKYNQRLYLVKSVDGMGWRHYSITVIPQSSIREGSVRKLLQQSERF